MEDYIYDYVNTQNSIYKKEKEILDIDHDAVKKKVNLKWFYKNLHIYQKEDTKQKNITRALLHGFGDNIVRKIDKNRLYISILNPHPDSVYNIMKIYPKIQILDTLLKD